MKALFLTSLQRTIRMMMVGSVLSQAMISQVKAQLPDCSSGTVMYAVFNDSTGSTTNKPSEIRPVNFATGAVGALMGGTTFLIQKAGSGGPYYGTASLAVDGMTQRFYVMTQMNSNAGLQKDIITINTLTNTMTVIGTTPTVVSGNIPVVLSDYHFVKLAISPTGIGYAIGVHRDTSIGSFNAAQCNPVISFTTCGALPVGGCSTIKLLGFLPYTGNHWHQFNGDIAFDNVGNLYFATAAYARVNGRNRYTDARLYKIAAANIPAVPGTGVIPMTLAANYNSLDSTVLNGIAFSPVGAMYFSTRRFPGGQSVASPPFINELDKSTVLGVAAPVAGFSVPTAGYSIADLGGCYFPLGVLAQNEMNLTSNYVNGMVSLRWQVTNNNQALYYEIQKSNDDANYETISRIDTRNSNQSSQVYTSMNIDNGDAKVTYYRIKQAMQNGMNYYSNVVKVNNNSKITLIGKPNPNPFINKFVVSALLRLANPIYVKIVDQDGRMVYHNVYTGQAGTNSINVNNLGGLKPGVYVVEVRVDDEVIREKLIKE